MRNFDWNAFEESKSCVACPTKEQAKDFLKTARDRGLEWCSGASLVDKDNWDNYKEKTVYYGGDNGVTYGDNTRNCVDGRKLIEWDITDKEFTFEEVVARIKNGEVYEPVDTKWSTKAIRKVAGEIWIENNRKSELLIVGALRYRLREKLKKYRVVTVEHKENGKGYEFISDISLKRGDMVVCDTRHGKTFGRVLKSELIELTREQAKEYKKIIKRV